MPSIRSRPVAPDPTPPPAVVFRLRSNNHPVGRVIDARSLPRLERRILGTLRAAYHGKDGGSHKLSFVRIAGLLGADEAALRPSLAALVARGVIHLSTCDMECYALCYAEQIALVERFGLERRWTRGPAWVAREKCDEESGTIPLLRYVKAMATGEGPALTDAPVPPSDHSQKR